MYIVPLSDEVESAVWNFRHNDVSRACRCHWERWRVFRPSCVSFYTLLSMNDTGVLLGMPNPGMGVNGCAMRVRSG
jgi:hypothetical protein